MFQMVNLQIALPGAIQTFERCFNPLKIHLRHLSPVLLKIVNSGEFYYIPN